MRMMIRKKDYVRLFIISKKIEPRNLEFKEIADLKITYYSYLVFYYKHEGLYSETAFCYEKILETLHNVVMFYCLSVRRTMSCRRNSRNISISGSMSRSATSLRTTFYSCPSALTPSRKCTISRFLTRF
jgi:hypothetical protein